MLACLVLGLQLECFLLPTITAATVAIKDNEIIASTVNSGITGYWYVYPISSVLMAFPTLSSAVMAYVTFVPAGNAGIVAVQMLSSMFVIGMAVHALMMSLA